MSIMPTPAIPRLSLCLLLLTGCGEPDPETLAERAEARQAQAEQVAESKTFISLAQRAEAEPDEQNLLALLPYLHRFDIGVPAGQLQVAHSVDTQANEVVSRLLRQHQELIMPLLLTRLDQMAAAMPPGGYASMAEAKELQAPLRFLLGEVTGSAFVSGQVPTVTVTIPYGSGEQASSLDCGYTFEIGDAGPGSVLRMDQQGLSTLVTELRSVTGHPQQTETAL